MPTLSAAVMAHPRRAAQVDELRSRLDRPVPVVWDQINDRHDTGVRALEAFDPTASHHLVVQDDALVCRDLLAGIERASKYVPQDAPLCLYIGRVKPFRERVNRLVSRAGSDVSWIRMQGLYWGVGIVIPTGHLPTLTEWFRGSAGQQITNYDRRVSRWYEEQHIPVWYPWPSLVDHRGDDSLVSGHGPGRHAHRFLGAQCSALDVDWSGAVEDMTRSRRADEERQRRARRARVVVAR